MTRNKVRQRIAPHCRADGACGGFLSDCLRQPSIADELSRWDLKQRTPNPDLERRTADKCAQSSARPTIVRPSKDAFCHAPGKSVIAHKVGSRPFLLQFRHIFPAAPRVWEGKMPSSTRTCPNEAPAKGRICEAKDNLPSFTPGFQFSRRRSFKCYTQIVQAPGT